MYETNVKEIVQILKKELRDYSLSKRKYIEKPGLRKLQLRHRKFTRKMFREKYPIPWRVGQAKLLKHYFGRNTVRRSCARITSLQRRKSRNG